MVELLQLIPRITMKAAKHSAARLIVACEQQTHARLIVDRLF